MKGKCPQTVILNAFQPRRVCLVLGVVLVSAGALAAEGQASRTDLDSGSVQSLRAGIEDLVATFGPRYADAQNLLGQADELARRLQSSKPAEAASAKAELAVLRRRALLANPLVASQAIVYVVRRQYLPDHHNTATFFPAAKNEYNNGAFSPGGGLKLLDVSTGKVKTLLRLPEGVARDPEVNFDGKKILLSIRNNPADSYHIYEINADGSGLKQLTRAADVDDLDPLYLADGSIAFSSTREPKYCMCNRHIMANLYRMEADGANILQIGKSTLFEGHGSLMPDGRILYSRWEYIDRNFGDAQGLWTVNPDGTNHAVFWGNNTPAPGGVLDARVIPGTERVVCTFVACHDRPWGALAIVDRQYATDDRAAVVLTWPAQAAAMTASPGKPHGGFDVTSSLKIKYEDPYPLSEKYFLCSRMTGNGEETGIFLLDTFGNEVLLHVESPGCFDPMPLNPRLRPGVIPTRRKFDGSDGTFYVSDVYRGTHMKGVQPGEAKYLRVIESPEKRFWTHTAWGGQGVECPGMNWHDFNNKRILGTVPVEQDGSAYFSLPSGKWVYFQLLDAGGKMIQSMRSGTIVQPGEVGGCVGCHDSRLTSAPPVVQTAMALRRPPNRLQGWYGPPREFSYLTEVQPVFNKYCVRCHDYGKEGARKLILAGDRENCFNASYRQFWTKGMISVVGAGPAEILQARSWGSSASRVVQVLEAGHPAGGPRLDKESMDRIITWIDINAPYYPSYATNYPDNFAGRSPLNDRQLEAIKKLAGDRWQDVSFDRPEMSPALSGLGGTADPRYQQALAILQAGKAALAQQPGADSPGFVPCPMDQWRQEKYLARQAWEMNVWQAIVQNRKVYDPPALAAPTGRK